MKVIKNTLVALFLMIFSMAFVWGEETKESIFSWDTHKFHLGFGVTATTGNLLGLIENARLYDALYNNKPYDYPGLTTEQKDAVMKLNKGMVRTLIVANMLASMEYGLRTRIMFHAFMSDIDLIFLPNDGTFNGRFDFELVPTVGVRLPWFIMPYLTAGPTFTFSFYPDKVANVENWKTKAGYGIYENFAFRVGLNIRTGIDLNFRRVMVGVFYQYEVKDFAEFTDFYNTILNGGFTPAEAAGKVFGYQSRFGVSLVINIL